MNRTRYGEFAVYDLSLGVESWEQQMRNCNVKNLISAGDRVSLGLLNFPTIVDALRPMPWPLEAQRFFTGAFLACLLAFFTFWMLSQLLLGPSRNSLQLFGALWGLSLKHISEISDS